MNEDIASGPLTSDAPEWLEKLYMTGAYSDLTIKCENEEWHVHKSVVCSQSKFFEKACKKDGNEPKHRVITLSHCDDYDEIVHHVIKYMYLDVFDDSHCDDPKSWATFAPTVFNLRMYAAADKHGLPRLAEAAESHFLSRLDAGISDEDLEGSINVLFTEVPSNATKMREHVVRVAASWWMKPDKDSYMEKRMEKLVEDLSGYGKALNLALDKQVKKQQAELTKQRASLGEQQKELEEQKKRQEQKEIDLEQQSKDIKQKKTDLEHNMTAIDKRKQDLDMRETTIMRRQSDFNRWYQEITELTPFRCPVCQLLFSVSYGKELSMPPVCPCCRTVARSVSR